MIGIRQMTLLHEKNRYKEFSGSSRTPERNTASEGNSSFFLMETVRAETASVCGAPCM